MPPYFDPRSFQMFNQERRNPEAQVANQDFRLQGPPASTSMGPRSNTSGSGDISRDPYHLQYAAVAQSDRKVHTGQLKIELGNTGEALNSARTKQELDKKLDQHGQEAKAKAKQIYKNHGK